MRQRAGITLLETLGCVGILSVLFVITAAAWKQTYERSAIAVAANNIRVLSAGGAAYVADHDHHFWLTVKDRATVTDSQGNTLRGSLWWYGFETLGSQGSGEGNRTFDSSQSPLAGYIPAGIRPDPSFALQGRAFKPKYKSGYIGIGYNAVLGGGRGASSDTQTLTYWSLAQPSRTAVFATCAQVNTFQSPASATRPMIEEFPYFDQKETTLHFIDGRSALVAFADGSGGILPLDESTRDNRLKDVKIGRFAPVGSFEYLK